MMNIQRLLAVATLTLAIFVMTGQTASAQSSPQVLRIVPQVNLTVLDPIFTTAYVTRNHGYMIYDTLFGTDEKGAIKPQMVDHWNVSANRKVWSFTLRSGLAFHDGMPVTSNDVIASLKRWSTRDSLGVMMARFVDRYEAVDPMSFRIHFREPFGLVLEALGKASSNVPFIMPARIAETPGNEQIKEHIGSGPYIFKLDEFKFGERVIYLKNTKYMPRKEAASGTAGGKVVNVERAEWLSIRDPHAQLTSLSVGEVDILEQPTAELYSPLRAMKDVRLVNMVPTGYQYTFRMNHQQPPFDNVLIRRAAMLAMGQEAVLRVQSSPGLFRFCKSLYPCGTSYENDNTGIFTGVPDPRAARKLLEEAGYKGEPIILMRATDFPTVTKAPLVAKQQLEQAGFKVDIQEMDWQTLLGRRARKEAPSANGWNAFITFTAATDDMSPVTMMMMNATGDKGWFGWQNDPTLEELKTRFARALTESDKKKAAEAAQLRAIDQITHVNLGQFFMPAAIRSNVSGVLTAGAQVYWNISKSK